MFSNRLTLAIYLLTAVKAQDCSNACGSAGNSSNLYGDLSKLMNGGSNCTNASTYPMNYGGSNTSIQEQCTPSQQQQQQQYLGGIYGIPPNGPGSMPGNPNGMREECELTTTLDCKSPRTQGSPLSQQLSNGPGQNYNNNGICTCDPLGNNNNGLGKIYGYIQPNGECVCNNNNGPSNQSTQPSNSPYLNPFNGSPKDQICDCSQFANNNGYGNNNYNQSNLLQNQGKYGLCDCSNQQNYGPSSPTGSNGASSPQGPSNVPCMNGGPGQQGTFPGSNQKQNSPFNLTECYNQNNNYGSNIRTAIIGKTELPISDNAVFATSSCSLANAGSGGCL